MTNYQIVTLAERPDFEPYCKVLSEEAWPAFLRNSTISNWNALFTDFRDFQFFLCDNNDKVMGLGHAMPIYWDGSRSSLPSGIDEVTTLAVNGLHNTKKPNTLCALAAIVSKEFRDQGISRLLIEAMKGIAMTKGLSTMIAPVRPTKKSLYPLVPMQRYVNWRNLDDSHFDPWIRVHVRLGAELLKVATHALVVEGTTSEWEKWTGMRFPVSGLYTVPNALQPVHINCEKDYGRYDDPNVWVKYAIVTLEKSQSEKLPYW